MLAAALVLVALTTVFSNVHANDQFLLLEVDKPENKSVQDYKDLLKNIEIMHFLKTIGSSQLRIVIKMNDAAAKALSNITLPGDVKSIAAGDLADKMQSIGVEWKRYNMPLPDTNLTLFERTLDCEGNPIEQLVAQLKAFGEALKPILNRRPYHSLFYLGGTPPKRHICEIIRSPAWYHEALIIINLPRSDIDLASAYGLGVLGGPGRSETKVEFVVNA